MILMAMGASPRWSAINNQIQVAADEFYRYSPTIFLRYGYWVRRCCSGMILSRFCEVEAYLPSTSSVGTAHASAAANCAHGAGWLLPPADVDVLPGAAVCVADPVPAPVPFPPAGARAGEDVALPGMPLTVVLGINGTPFIMACTAIPSPTLIQSSYTHTNKALANGSPAEVGKICAVNSVSISGRRTRIKLGLLP